MKGIYVSRRNKKLIPNAKTRFLIFSIPAIKTCPNRCEACESGKIPKNMVVRFSLWGDTEVKGKVYKGTNANDYELAKLLGLPIYTAVDSIQAKRLTMDNLGRA